ncbi:hypothetical protein BU24DRAFT_427170 [Aaosphaeria arxii CBS 175.79]|uniref:CNH domain-containing protein n=1 Tax=Aaosphaeria arxii CBS 175.79 TaxID=1450172 RepID=A0A6A5XD93_9PLEO|nr:uncharacterized protein BU24DRAFT_427170 [Aaosphaeria arxii CBS 175.79]KAF2010968.1 hypothetical protein BU24DRAFT_427170 [Aaosphaeria arxii CBS 175.79]
MSEASSSIMPQRRPPQDGAYVLRRLVSDLPLSADGQSTDVNITCVEVWNNNLYVGTSAAEILHFVLLPPEPNASSNEPTAIIASRLEPPYSNNIGVGVQQILLLPKVNKACILCNNTLTFYSLPELSPDSSTKPLTCTWVGGTDLNIEDEAGGEGVVVMLGLKSRIRLIRVSEHAQPRSLKTIEYGGCLISVRRDAFSCAADSHSYALLDVEHQQKIGLFPISSLDPEAGHVGGAAEDITTTAHAPSRSTSSASVHPRGPGPEEHRGHGRSSSLGIFGNTGPVSRTESPRPSRQRYGFDVPESLSRTISPAPGTPGRSPERLGRPSSTTRRTSPSPEKPLPPPPVSQESTEPQVQVQVQEFVPLKPHVASPCPTEFLLTVGTTPAEPGVGMFVNLDGDMCRGSIQFASYPDAIVVDGSGIDLSASISPDFDAEEGYVLAAVRNLSNDNTEYGIEIQRWDVDPGEGEASKEWLDLTPLGEALSQEGGQRAKAPLGLRTVVEKSDLIFSEIGEKLTVKRLKISSDAQEGRDTTDHHPQAKLEKEDLEFAERLSKLQTRTILWTGDQISWVVRNPLVTRLDARLEYAQTTPTGDGERIQPTRSTIEQVLGDVRDQEPRNESEYLGLIYIRQKASLLLFMDLILRSNTNIIIFESEKRITEQALIEGEIDPRVVLSLLPILNQEVVQGPEGIQISGGITSLVEEFSQQNEIAAMPASVNGPFGDNLLRLVKTYLQFWRRRKGMASVTNDPYVFQTIDAAYLHILLLLDQNSSKGPAASGSGSVRDELNKFVDGEVECFDRAVTLLEKFKRLYVLSRFYQCNSKSSAKASNVLSVWQRILEGEADEGGEFVNGEVRVREYLSKIRDQSLVEEYGSWLANRNPKLGVQVFADDSSRVKFDPARAVPLLREKAPGAVKEYLEYLVFGQKHTQYVNELISFYLDIVIDELESSSESRDILLQTYETYRILQPPKPTYRQFITDNALGTEWWNSRLRLLQLLGSNQPATSSYDVPLILSRLEPYSKELVPEMIILSGRQGRHQEAIRLLTHGLGDYDTAISYCLLGGSSIYRPEGSGYIPANEIPSREEQAVLLHHLLQETLRLDDLAQRVARTGELLERFGGWFDVIEVLEIIPNEWSVDVLGAFLISSLRLLVKERAETGIAKALNGARNLQISVDLADKIEEAGPTIERVE